MKSIVTNSSYVARQLAGYMAKVMMLISSNIITELAATPVHTINNHATILTAYTGSSTVRWKTKNKTVITDSYRAIASYCSYGY